MLSLALGLVPALAVRAHAQPTAGDADDADDAAGPPDPIAAYQVSVDRGTKAFRDGRFVDARVAFERAFAIHNDPILLFNIASCWRRGGDPSQAIIAYRRFLEAAATGDPRRDLAEQTIETLEDQLGLPVTSRLAVPAKDEAPEPAATPAGPSDSPGSTRRTLGLSVATVGVIGLIIGGVEAGRAYSAQNELDTMPRGTRWDQHQVDTFQRGTDAAQWGVVFAASGAVLAAAGVTLYLSGRAAEHDVTVSAAPHDGGGEVLLSGHF